jgi:predicted metal-dependent phosphoesterase TrpH
MLAACALLACAPSAHAQFVPGTRVLLDAHNCYPYHGRWADRIDRALSAGTPLAIEQDLVWYRDPKTGKGRSLVAHDEQDKPNLGLDGSEPTMREYFFERVRPIVERALLEQRRDTWPIITLNLDLKSEEPEHLSAIWALLREYRSWLTTARKTADISDVQPMTVGPLLVLTGESDEQRKAFYDDVAVGDSLLVFGAARPRSRETGLPGARTNYHRWWNNPWNMVEAGGQRNAGAWTREDNERLELLVRNAHDAGLWIRFYTLNGHDPSDTSGGWSEGYNFGSEEAARIRWKAAIGAGVDFVAVDQYELFARTLHGMRTSAADIVITGDLTRDDYKRLFERTFDVPDGVSQVQVELSYTGVDAKTVIDLGVRDPHGFRGWSGGGPQTITIGKTRASFGYLPGQIVPGAWAVVLGVPNIRVARHDSYTVTIHLLRDEEIGGAVLRRGSAWYVGDLHSHSGHSDGRTVTAAGVTIPVPTHRVFDAAAAARLDFVALTDHNTTSHWLDVDRLQPYYDHLLLLHGREITTYHGHSNAIGAGFVSINHPARADDEQCMGCRWDHVDAATLSMVQGVEVVNDTSSAGWAFWAELLNRGFHLTAVGGSDEHTPENTTDRRIGRPATVVFAGELSERAIVDGLRSGRVYIRTRGVEGPGLDLFATIGEQRYEMGSEMPVSKTVTLHAHLTGAIGQRVSWIRNGKSIAETSVPANADMTLECDAHAGDWFTVVVRDGDTPTVFANAIYVRRN